ncbi:STAS domain-containing protein [Actinomadura sp. DC4]|uniref:STAS domain-containing protein n=1 Tax=Actinomadura sp. DC4 TaxID=3055069 RepID=UPI0025B0423A|nr:STAS domain-containing protein [Actinomadura sp. DC4]MDN3354300.1 STAS domain-containing protein [Actinomadura sp. DC4]
MPGHTVLAVGGELDIETTAALRLQIISILAATTTPVIFDLSGVSFCDASGLALLVGTQRRAKAEGRPVVLAAPRPNVRKLLHITGLDRTFNVHATLASAELGAGRHSVVA